MVEVVWVVEVVGVVKVVGDVGMVGVDEEVGVVEVVGVVGVDGLVWLVGVWKKTPHVKKSTCTINTNIKLKVEIKSSIAAYQLEFKTIHYPFLHVDVLLKTF